MPHTYDVTQPRISIRPAPQHDHSEYARERELGQAAAMGEAMFWLSIGYSVHVAEWNGTCYVSSCNFLPADLL